ncbi:hypothetical protein VTN00DRAFT_5183 [Thermoascus crustaceus]|uniref:uncharacterized protein n=1 Tax=Thermoascus crustaceus TaxID=5088 RepID=UPI0037443182
MNADFAEEKLRRYLDSSANYEESRPTRFDHHGQSDLAEPSNNFDKADTKFQGPVIKRKGRLLRAKRMREPFDMDAAIRDRLTTCGYTAKELETLKQTSKHSYTMQVREEEDTLHLLKGRFIEQETEILKQMYEDGCHPRVIADRLKRKQSSVIRKIKALAPYFQSHNHPVSFHGPQTLSPELEDSIFHARMSTIWEGLMEFPKTLQWEDTISAFPSEFWLEQIAQHTPRQVKSLLASHQPPDVALLESLGWSETSAAGVYAWILPSKCKPVCFDKQFHLLLGTTSQYGVGLRGTKDQLLSKWSSKRKDNPRSLVEGLNLSKHGKLVTLLEVPFKDDSHEETLRVRALVRLARAVFAIWLGAVRESSKPLIQKLVPWELEYIRYRGLASCKFLAFNLHDCKRK